MLAELTSGRRKGNYAASVNGIVPIVLPIVLPYVP